MKRAKGSEKRRRDFTIPRGSKKGGGGGEEALPTDAIIALLARNLFHLALTHHPPTSSVIDHHFSPGDQRLHVSTFHPRSLQWKIYPPRRISILSLPLFARETWPKILTRRDQEEERGGGGGE